MDVLSLMRTSARSLLRRPGYALLVVATLAVGIGGATAIFSLVQGVLLRSLPYGDADRIVRLDPTDATTGYGISLSIPNYRDWSERNEVFDRFGASAGWSFVRRTADGAEPVDARVVLGDFFGTLGLSAESGSVIAGDDTGPGATPVAVLGHGFWERAYGADPGVIGRALVLDDQPYEIIGVLPAGVGYPRPGVDVYTPMGVLADSLPWNARTSSFGTVALARLAPGVAVPDAQRDMNRVTDEVDALEGKPIVTAEVRPLSEAMLGGVQRGLWLLLGAVGLVLLVAGANVANLALARGEAREAELAVRRALGAGSGDVVRLLLAESVWLSVLGGGLGIVLAYGVAGVLPRRLPLQIPALMAGGIGLNAPVLGFALALTALTGALFALGPALRVAVPAGALRRGARATGGREARRFRNGLVVGQVALSVMLLVGAGLMLRSLLNMASVDRGFGGDDVVAARIAQPRGAFASTEEWLAFYDGINERLNASPDVARTAETLLVPLSDRSWERIVLARDGDFDPDHAPSVLFNVVSESYFGVMDIPVLRGRTFTSADAGDAPPTVVIDETMAERFWPGEEPIGKMLTLMEPIGDDDDPDQPDQVIWRTVVGVVPNVRHYELTAPSRVEAWVPMRQAAGASRASLTVLAKARGKGTAVPGLIRRAVAAARPDIPISEVRPVSAYVADQLGPGRALSATTSVFGIVAALLAALGIFGVLSLAVVRRGPEIGLRMAVGASPGEVVRMVLREGASLTGLGMAAGVLGAALGGRVLGAFLFDVRPWDATVYGAVVALLAAVATAAALGPALRASRTSPVRVLKEQ